MNMVDRQIVDFPKVSVVDIESILDIISYADEDSLRRMMRHARVLILWEILNAFIATR